ncbi:MAG: chromosome segregation SMC family protein [Candidatus Micrarchaeota archaeon]
MHSATSIQAVDKLYYISKIKFRGFKSFKNAEAEFPTGFIALAGPNGSGKSNVADAIRFCFGEMGAKAIRVKRASELIHINSSRGEVTVVIEGNAKDEERFEIIRSIKEDGKTSYRLNGRPLTRTNVLESLRPHGLEIGHHNIIAQGQVQRIVEMHAKDRRGIIDSVAGISEFEQKKKEALSELSKVETKISEAKIVMAERGAYLSELEKEKDAALAHLDAKKNLERSRATLLDTELQKLNKSFDSLLQKRSEITKELDEINSKLAEFQKNKNEFEGKRKELADKIGSNAKKETLLGQMQDAKVDIAQKTTLLEEKKSQKEELIEARKELMDKKTALTHDLHVAQAQIKQKEQYLQKLKEELEKAKKEAGISDEKDEKDAHLEKVQELLLSAKEKKASLEGSLSGIEKMVAHSTQMVENAEAEYKKLEGAGKNEEIEKYSNSINQISSQLDKLFEEEKELNKKIPSLDKQMLEAKERVASLRGSASPASRNPALITVKSLKEDKTPGIYGTVSELINVDGEYEAAVEAAAGARLNYVIVDTVDTADFIIKKLKSTKSGKCSFIPLDKIAFNKHSPNPPSGSLGRMTDFVDYPPQIDNAMRYLFDTTFLVQNISSAKNIGVGKFRMATIEGELLERSGVITGGSLKSNLMARSSLQRAEKDVDSTKSERDSLYSSLYSVRDEMQKSRKERASLELKLRTKEAEFGSVSERKARMEKINGEISKWKSELSTSQSEIKSAKNEISSLQEKEKSLSSKIQELKKAQVERKEEQKKIAGATRENYEKLLEQHSSFSSEIDGKRQEGKLLQTQLDSLAKEINENSKDVEGAGEKIKELEKQAENSKTHLFSLEEKLKEATATVKKHYAKMQKLQEELDEIGRREGQLKFSHDSFTKELNEINIKHASTETKLVDLKAEWEKYPNIELFKETTKTRLEEMAKESEEKITQLGEVNQKAPELYTQKKKDLEEMEGKVKTLDSEKTAVISLIEEIETKKKTIFLDTFAVVNEHFKKLFGMVFKGEGSLALDDPENPLDSGLSMRARGLNEKRDRYMEAMSGGEKTLLSLMFIFSLQMKKQAPFYILDEAEAALDKTNAIKMADFIKQMSKNSQFIVITHHDTLLSAADVVLGVTRGAEGSKIVGVQLSSGSPFLKGQPSSPKKQEVSTAKVGKTRKK